MVKRAAGALLESIRFEDADRRPLSTRLYVALRDIILSGGFGARERLPATRTLARELGLSRTTVIEAFDRLTCEGLISSHVGSGTFVSAALHIDRPMPALAAGAVTSDRAPRLSRRYQRAAARLSERQRLPHCPRAFTTALPAFDAFPLSQWAKLAAKHWRGSRDDVMGYGEACGHPLLRRAVASHLRTSRGIACDTEQIFIVGGAQQAFHLIGSMLVEPGDKVWFENPGAIGARNSLIACGAELLPVPVDKDGLMVENGLAQCRRFRLAFVTPSHQQPLGMVMSLERRFALLSAASRADAWVIEDDYDGEFFFDGRPLPTLKSVDTTGLVIYVGTFSKSIFPSLRLGFILSPSRLVGAFHSVMTRVLNGVPTWSQATVAEFMEEGHFHTHVRRMRRIYAERGKTLHEAARRRLGGLLDVAPAVSGLHTVGYLTGGLGAIEVARAANERSITVSPIDRFSIAPVAQKGLVLGFGAVQPQEIAAGVDVLAQVLETQLKCGRAAKPAARPALKPDGTRHNGSPGRQAHRPQWARGRNRSGPLTQ